MHIIKIKNVLNHNSWLYPDKDYPTRGSWSNLDTWETTSFRLRLMQFKNLYPMLDEVKREMHFRMIIKNLVGIYLVEKIKTKLK